MNVRYMIGRALSGTSLSLDCSMDTIRSAEILIALGWVRETCPDAPGLASLILRVKYGYEWRSLKELIEAVEALVKATFARKRWIVKARADMTAADTVYRMACQVTHEILDDTCIVCNGDGEVRHPKTNVKYRCPECNGTGKERASGRERANALQMHPESYRETWEKRFDLVLEEVREIERRACSKMKANLLA